MDNILYLKYKEQPENSNKFSSDNFESVTFNNVDLLKLGTLKGIDLHFAGGELNILNAKFLIERVETVE